MPQHYGFGRPGAALATTDRLIAGNQAFRRRQPGVNLTAQALAPPAAGGYGAGVRMGGGGLRLGAVPGTARNEFLNPGLGAPQAAPAAMQALAPQAAPRFSTIDRLTNAAAGQNAALDVASRSKYGTKAIPLDEQRTAFTEDGTPFLVPGLRGSGQGKPMDMAKRSAYLARIGEQQAGRNALVMKNAQARSGARRERISARKRVPSPLEQMAARNPQLAAQLAQIRSQENIAQIGAGGRKSIAEIEAGWRGGAQQGQQYATDTAADVAIMTSDTTSPQDKMAAAQRLSAARGGAGAAGTATGGMALGAVPPEALEQIEQMDPARAAEALAAQGASPKAIQDYRNQRTRQYQQPGFPQRALEGYGGLFEGVDSSGLAGTLGSGLLKGLGGIADFFRGGLRGEQKPIVRLLTKQERERRLQGNSK